MLEKKKEKLTEEELKDKEEFARNYSAMVEAKLRKAEKKTWMLRDLDYIE